GRVRGDGRRADAAGSGRSTQVRRAWLLAACALLACGGDEAKVAKGTPVTAERITAHRIVEEIQATGQLVAVEEASVAAEVGGRITAMRVAEGAHVSAGGVVVGGGRGGGQPGGRDQ